MTDGHWTGLQKDKQRYFVVYIEESSLSPKKCVLRIVMLTVVWSH